MPDRKLRGKDPAEWHSFTTQILALHSGDFDSSFT